MTKLKFVLLFAAALAVGSASATESWDDNLAPASAPAIEASQTLPAPSAHYYPYHQQLTFRGGVGTEFPRPKSAHTVLGFNYLFPEFLSPHWELGADLRQNSRGHVHFGRRWIHNERFYFRPSVTLQLDHDFDPALGLGTLVRRQNWYVRMGAALEYVVANPYSLRAELEFLANFDNQRAIVTLGVSRGW